MSAVSRTASFASLLICVTAATVARAQQEFPPPQGKGRIVVVASGMSGPAHYETVARVSGVIAVPSSRRYCSRVDFMLA